MVEVVALHCFSVTSIYFLPFAFGAALNGATAWFNQHERLAFELFVIGTAMGPMTYDPSHEPVRNLLIPRLQLLSDDAQTDHASRTWP
jgi:hypothetical protein